MYFVVVAVVVVQVIVMICALVVYKAVPYIAQASLRGGSGSSLGQVM
jgi:hypothetical protein